MPIRNLATAAIIVLLAIGCSSAKYSQGSAEFISGGKLPPLPGDSVSFKTDLPRMDEFHSPFVGRVVITWQNRDSSFSTNYLTGIEGSTNLSQWSRIEEVPYEPSGTITLTNGPGVRYFRVYNRIKP